MIANISTSDEFFFVSSTYKELQRARCPFPLLRLPPFAPLRSGDWELKWMPMAPRMRGYFGGVRETPRGGWVLVEHGLPPEQCAKGRSYRVWMSVTPMELESQSHHALVARGRVLVGGFGMGVLAWNLARKRDVDEVIVIERDSRAIEVAEKLVGMWEGHHQAKLKLVQADMLDYRCNQAKLIDFALIDIWPGVGAMELRGDMQRIASNLPQVGQFGAWGQELDFVEWGMRKAIPFSDLAPGHWAAYGKEIGVPLIMSTGREEAMMVAAAKLASLQSLTSHLLQD